MKVSLVVPCYNEEENVARLFDEIDTVLEKTKSMVRLFW